MLHVYSEKILQICYKWVNVYSLHGSVKICCLYMCMYSNLKWSHSQALSIYYSTTNNYRFSTWYSNIIIIINDYTYLPYFRHSFIFTSKLLISKSICLFLLCFYIARLCHGNPLVNCMRHLLSLCMAISGDELMMSSTIVIHCQEVLHIILWGY